MREDWLRSEDHQKWADAMCACQSGAPWECGGKGRCSQGGDCFTTERQAVAVAWQMINRLTSENRAVEEQLKKAVAFLRYGGKDAS